jgi:hypothetical protein
VKSQKQRDEERRRQKLAEMQEQIDEGTLTVRKMTPKERKENPPRPRPTDRRRR